MSYLKKFIIVLLHLHVTDGTLWVMRENNEQKKNGRNFAFLFFHKLTNWLSEDTLLTTSSDSHYLLSVGSTFKFNEHVLIEPET